MASMNRVFLIGNLTRDPETRSTPTGKTVASLRLAVSRKYRTAAGEPKEDTCYVDVVVWDRQAEIAGEYLRKGSPILVEGSLRFEEWESKGEKRSRLTVHADRIQFMDRTRRAEGGEGDARPRDGGPEAAPDAAPPAGAGKQDDDNLPF